MPEVFNLPTIGDAMTEGEIVQWLVGVGDEIAVDQPICSVETDKSVVELTTPYKGTVLSLGAAEGETVPVGAPLIVVGQAGEVVDSSTTDDAGPPQDETGSTEATNGDVHRAVLSPLIRKLADDNQVDLQLVTGSGPGGRITRDDVLAAAGSRPAPHLTVVGTATATQPLLAMPKVRKAARDRSIDLASLLEDSGQAGTGAHGSITMADLDRLDVITSSPTVVPLTGPIAPRRERLSAMRRSIAAHLSESARTIPQFTSTVEVDVTTLLATRAALAKDRDHPIPLDALLIRLLIPVLEEHPVINAMLEGQPDDTGAGVPDEVVYFNHFDIGVAVDTPDGLMVPVVRRADQRDLDDLCHEVLRLADAARSRTIQPGDLGGQTFTVNNVGALGIVSGTPILPLGTSTIAAFGVARPLVRLQGGQPVEVPTMTISATFDHRLIDGGDSARFLTQLKRHLEIPALGLL